MLKSLTIRNIVLIDHLSLDLQTGFTALTGETGAGKSILLDSLGLILGKKAETRLLRRGTDTASVTAEFAIQKSHPVRPLLEEQDLPVEDTLIVRRTLSTDGRSKAFVNNEPVSVNFLKTLGEELVEIHGQFETQTILDPGTHGRILDFYADVTAEIQTCWKNWKAFEKELETLEIAIEKERGEEDYLRQSLYDLETLDPLEGEEEELARKREMLMNREKILSALNETTNQLSRAETSIINAWKAVEKIAGKTGENGGTLMDILDRQIAEMQEAQSVVRDIYEENSDESHSLEDIDDRLYKLKAQARKHDCAVDDLPGVKKDLARSLALIENREDELQTLFRKTEQAKKIYTDEAEKLSKLRIQKAKELDQTVARELAPLKLEKARFETKIETLPEARWTENGFDRVQFMVATNPGADPGPLHKIASGGEMARFMLALKVVMSGKTPAKTMIFDEVDTGIGGPTAAAVGARLSRLGQDQQVIVVTHSPQVAARSNHHLIVMKQDNNGEDKKALPVTTVITLDHSEKRQDEIARMLSAAEVTDEARAAARKLLETGT